MQTETAVEQASAISDLLRQKNTVEKELILKNFRIGRLVSQACQESGDDVIPKIMTALVADGMTVFEDFLYKSQAVFESYRTEQRLLEVGKELDQHFNWAFLARQCFKPMGSAKATELYVHSVLSQAERAIGAVENLLVSDVPDEFKEQAVSLVPYITGHSAVASSTIPDNRTLKVLHTGDLHYREKGLADIKKSGDFMVAQAAVENPTLIVIAGDLCDERHYYDSAPFKGAVDFVRRMAEIAPVFLLKGTTNHDGYDIGIFADLSTKHPVCVADQIDCIGFGGGKFGPVQNLPALDAVIFALPPVNKANLLAYSSRDMEESRLETIDLLLDVFQMWGETAQSIKAAGVPVIGVGHLTVRGCQLSTGQEMVGRDIEVGIGDLALANADAWYIAHIHKQQSWGNIFYCGSTVRLNYGEKEEKGFWIHEHLESLKSRFIVIPTKELVTVDFDEAPALDLLPEIPVDGKVRIRYKVKEEDIHSVDEAEIERKLMELGASEVKIEKSVIPTVRMRAEGISKATGPRAKLEKWAEATGTVLSEGVYDKLELLLMEIEEDAPTEEFGSIPAHANGSKQEQVKKELAAVLF